MKEMAYEVVSFGLGSRLFLGSECFLFKGLFPKHSQYLYSMEHYMERVLTHHLFILFFKFSFVFVLWFLFLIAAAINPYLPNTVHMLCMKARVWNDGSPAGNEANGCTLLNHPPCLSAALRKKITGCWVPVPMATQSSFSIQNLLVMFEYQVIPQLILW